jgi:hypothetical protein
LLIDRNGYLRLHQFGHVDDMRLGAMIASLIGEAPLAMKTDEAAKAAGCDEEGCRPAR